MCLVGSMSCLIHPCGHCLALDRDQATGGCRTLLDMLSIPNIWVGGRVASYQTCNLPYAMYINSLAKGLVRCA